jgi:hypothetical protein
MPYKQVKYSVAALFVGGTGTGAATQLHRVTSLNDSFDIPFQDVTQLGKMAPFTRETVGTPTPTLSFDYFATNGVNEKRMGFNINATGVGGVPFLSGILNRTTDEKNYYIAYVPEGADAAGSALNTSAVKCVGIGNAYVTSYNLNASVGEFVTSSVTVEGLNYDIRDGGATVPVPTVNPETGELITGVAYSLPAGVSEITGMPKVLRPGDIEFDFSSWNGMGTKLNGDGKAHIQSFSLDIPLSRQPLERLGSNFAFSRELDFPINATLTLETNLSDLQTGSLSDLINKCGQDDFNASITLKGCTGVSGGFTPQMRIWMNGITRDSENYSLSVGGGGRTASVAFSVKIGSPQDLTHNVWVSGAGQSM